MEYRDGEFEWDVGKSDRNRRRHGFDFFHARRVFEDAYYIEAIDERLDYGEERYIAVGAADGKIVTLVYTIRGSRRRIISAWPSDENEKDEYVARFS